MKVRLQIAEEHLDVRYIPIDLDDSATIAAATSRIEADSGHLDSLVNNAGIAVHGE